MKYTADDLRALDSALATKCVEDLKKLARNYYVQGSAKMRKQELIGEVGRDLPANGTGAKQHQWPSRLGLHLSHL